MISFRCLMCSKTVNATVDQQGATIDCPECGATLNVPKQSVEAPAPVVNRADSQVAGRETKEVLADGTEAKSIFRAKRKAQQEAKAEGVEFDSSKFDQDKATRNSMLGILAVAIIAIGWYAYYLSRPVQRYEFTEELANELLQGMNTSDDSSLTTLLDRYMDAQCTCTETMGVVLEYVDSSEKLEEVMDDLKRLSQIALIQNPLVNAVDRNAPNMQVMSVMEEFKGRQAGAHIKLENEVKRIQQLDPAMATQLKDNVPAIALLDMFQN